VVLAKWLPHPAMDLPDWHSPCRPRHSALHAAKPPPRSGQCSMPCGTGVPASAGCGRPEEAKQASG